MSHIKNLKIFSWIDGNVVDKILENAEKKEFSAGKIIINEGEENNGKGYIIEHGEVSVKMKGKEIQKLWEWEMFWEIALLNEEQRTATIEALTDISVIILSQDHFIDMINNDENKINKEIVRRMEENLGRE